MPSPISAPHACPGNATTRSRCSSTRNGEAQFQYLISADIQDSRRVSDRCRAATAPCTVVVRALEGDTHGAIQTIFGDEVPPAGESRCHARRDLSLAGETVTVRVRNYPPNVAMTAMLCAAPDATGPRCGAPGPTAPLVVGRNGSGSAKLAIAPGRVGPERESCSRGDDCGISVASDDVFARCTCRAGHIRRTARVPPTTQPGWPSGSGSQCSSPRLPPGFSCGPTGRRSARQPHLRSTARSTPTSTQ